MFAKALVNLVLDEKMILAFRLTYIGVILAVVGGIFYLKRWKWLWREWITTTDHKKIGTMYIIVSLVMLLRGFSDALVMRAQQSLGGGTGGIISADTFQQFFTAHGSIMIFFVAMGLMFGIINLVLPLMLGSRDVAFPFLNATSFWLFAGGALLINTALVIGGEFAATGWLSYPPLSGLEYSPGPGVDYWLWSIQISGIGSLLSGINFIITILKMRAPGMKMMQMPIFAWSVLGSMILVVFSFPILTATLFMLSLDRSLGMHFFTSDFGGNPMMYINLIWAWGHPEVYILVLPAFGIFSEIVPVFSKKSLFGYKSMVWALMAITFFSYVVWLHHFFTMGSGASVNSFFGIMTMVIAIPTGVKIFNWLFTMYKGRITFTSPMVWFIGFVALFTIGGITGVLLAVPPLDFQFHNSLFLVAHFHNMIIGGVVFGFMAGLTYWFPKFTGFRLNETLGKLAGWCWIFGFILAFGPLYILGLMGATRRLDGYDASLGWQWLFVVAAIGALLIGAGVVVQLLQLAVSIWQRKRYKVGDDPWDGRTLEWAIKTPVPFYNFAVLPKATERDPLWNAKKTKSELFTAKLSDVHMPKNTPFGLYIGLAATLGGFAVIWHVWWLFALAIVATVGCLVVYLTSDEREYVLTADEMKRYEGGRR